MKQIIILALLLILVLGDQHQNKHNHYKHKKDMHLSGFSFQSLLSEHFCNQKNSEKKKTLKENEKQRMNNLSETVVYGEPMNDNVQQPQFYAVPIEQYKQFKNWLNQQQQQQQQEALLQQQQQQQQIQQQILLQQQQSAQRAQIPQQPVTGYPIYQQYPQQVPSIVYPQLLNKSNVEIQLPEVRVPQ